MATIKVEAGPRNTLTTTAVNSLASATYVSAGIIDVSAIDSLDVVIEVEITPGTVSGNKQVVVFARVSMDGTNYSTGPVSGTAATDEPNLRFLGTVPLNSNAVLQRNAISVISALGYVPPFIQVVVKNDSGAAVAASGNAVYFTSYTGTSA